MRVLVDEVETAIRNYNAYIYIPNLTIYLELRNSRFEKFLPLAWGPDKARGRNFSPRKASFVIHSI